ncbi:protein glass-like [Dermacentor silvarum]|uniref:protein glass-like n=1 Tax=Dermacentor silvarum TaxID=543639 RepID=UPI002100B511|nr:protein glass-like [Dermacentor silvarum]
MSESWGDTIADVLLSLKDAVVHPNSPAGGVGAYGAGPAEAPPPPPPPHMFPTSMSVNLSMNMTMGVTSWEPSYATHWAPPPYHHHHPSTGYAKDVAAPPPLPPPAPHQVAAGQVAGGVVAQGGIAGVPGAARGSDGRVNLCGICGKAYARPSTLKMHLRTHSGGQPDGPPAHALRREAVPLPGVRAPLLAELVGDDPHAHPLGRAALPLLPLQEGLLGQLYADQSGNLNRHMRVHANVS